MTHFGRPTLLMRSTRMWVVLWRGLRGSLGFVSVGAGEEVGCWWRVKWGARVRGEDKGKGAG